MLRISACMIKETHYVFSFPKVHVQQNLVSYVSIQNCKISPTHCFQAHTHYMRRVDLCVYGRSHIGVAHLQSAQFKGLLLAKKLCSEFLVKRFNINILIFKSLCILLHDMTVLPTCIYVYYTRVCHGSQKRVWIPHSWSYRWL